MARNVRVVTGPRATGEVGRTQELADALTVRALRSRAPQQGGPVQVAMSPWEGVAQLGEAWIAGRVRSRADELAAAQREGQQGANRDMVEALTRNEAPRRLDEQGRPTGAPVELPTDLEGKPFLSSRGEILAAAMRGMDPQQAGNALGGAIMNRALAGAPEPQKVDVGDAIVYVDAQGREVRRIPKGATPDVALRERGENARYDRVSGNTRATVGATMRGQDVSAATAQRGQDMSALTAELGRQGTGNRAQAEADAAAAQKARDIDQVWNMYSTARAGVMSGLEDTRTGPIWGRLPAFTANQQTAEGGVAAMAPVLKQLFRVSGEGVFTDRDQALLLDMVPKRTDEPEAREAKMRNIDAIVRAKLGLPAESAAAGGATGGWGASADDDDALIGRYLQGGR